MANKYTVKKYNGDDCYSYAIFLKEDVADLDFIVFYGEATPIMSGLDRHDAQARKQRLEAEA